MSRREVLEKLNLNPLVKRIWIFTFLLLITIIGIMFLPWQQSVKGEGVLIAYQPEKRPFYIYAPISGFVKRYHIKEDRFVKKGRVIAEMIDLDENYIKRLRKIQAKTEEQIKMTEETIDILQEKIRITKEKRQIGIQIYNNKIEKIKNKIESLKVKKISLEKNFEITKNNYDRIKKLYEEGIESKRKLELEENKLVKAEADLRNTNIEINIENQNLEITLNEKEKFLREMNNKILSIEKQLAEAKVKLNKYIKEYQKASSQLSRYRTSTSCKNTV